jgi:hypothetical protein
MHYLSAEAVAQRLFERHYPIHGIPTAITSDQGPQFVSDLWRHFCKLLDMNNAYQLDFTLKQMAPLNK